MLRCVICLLVVCGALLSCSGDKEVRAYAGLFAEAGGDPDAGRETFVELGCATCHTVQGEAGLPEPADTIEPFLLRQEIAGWPASLLAEGIVFPSHAIEGGGESEGQLSRMGDFSDAMTVRQMIDLIAYFQSL